MSPLIKQSICLHSEERKIQDKEKVFLSVFCMLLSCHPFCTKYVRSKRKSIFMGNFQCILETSEGEDEVQTFPIL